MKRLLPRSRHTRAMMRENVVGVKFCFWSDVGCSERLVGVNTGRGKGLFSFGERLLSRVRAFVLKSQVLLNVYTTLIPVCARLCTCLRVL